VEHRPDSRFEGAVCCIFLGRVFLFFFFFFCFVFLFFFKRSHAIRRGIAVFCAHERMFPGGPPSTTGAL